MRTTAPTTTKAKPASKGSTNLTSNIKIPRELANKIRAACGNWSVRAVCTQVLENAADEIEEMVRPLSVPSRKTARRPMNTPALLASLWQEITPLKPNPVAGMEAMAVVYLDQDGCLIDWTILGVGIMGVTVDHRIITAEGKQLKASAFALIHNHPRECYCSPSDVDYEMVRFSEEHLSTADCRFLDSIIVNTKGWYSIKEGRQYSMERPTSPVLREGEPLSVRELSTMKPAAARRKMRAHKASKN